MRRVDIVKKRKQKRRDWLMKLWGIILLDWNGYTYNHWHTHTLSLSRYVANEDEDEEDKEDNFDIDSLIQWSSQLDYEK